MRISDWSSDVCSSDLAMIYRPVLVDGFDPDFLRDAHGGGTLYHFIFLGLVVVNLVAAFQALGSLMAVGLMMLPALAARYWTRSLIGALVTASGIALLSGSCGLLVSSEAPTSELQSLMRISYAVFCLKKTTTPP